MYESYILLSWLAVILFSDGPRRNVMASFQEAVAKTELFEGGYVNNPHDSGGETYRGISRKNWPKWAGWAMVDAQKNCTLFQTSFPACLEADTRLQGEVIDFYHKNFWDYDGLNDQYIAWKVFDLGVNIGKSHAVKILQQAVGTNLNGVYEPNTERLANLHPAGSLATILRASAEQYHKQIVVTHPKDAVFLKGWLKRDEA